MTDNEQTEDPRLARIEDVTRTRWEAFSYGLTLLGRYQDSLPEDRPLFYLEDVDGDEVNEPGMTALLAIANLPSHAKVSDAVRELLEEMGWFEGGTWQYRLQLIPKW